VFQEVSLCRTKGTWKVGMLLTTDVHDRPEGESVRATPSGSKARGWPTPVHGGRVCRREYGLMTREPTHPIDSGPLLLNKSPASLFVMKRLLPAVTPVFSVRVNGPPECL